MRKRGADEQLRWSYNPLLVKMGADTLRSWYGDEQMAQWKSTGLTDEETDIVAITLGMMPWEIWGGWIEAGLDIEGSISGAE